MMVLRSQTGGRVSCRMVVGWWRIGGRPDIGRKGAILRKAWRIELYGEFCGKAFIFSHGYRAMLGCESDSAWLETESG
jgi:hypothetical protein